MLNLMRLPRGFLLIICATLLACGEENSNKTEPVVVQPVQRAVNDNATRSEESTEFKSSLIEIADENLEIRVALDDDDDRSKIIRFAKIADRQPITVFQSSVYIQNAINNQARLAVKLQLAYQPDYNPNDMTDMTIVSNQLTHQVAGYFHWSGTVTECKNIDCSVSVDTRKPEIEQNTEANHVSVKELHKLSIIWDEDTFEYIFSLDDVQTRVDMRPYMLETKFDTKNFRYASLSAEVGNVDSESDSGRIVVRFGQVFVNGHLYDDFSAEHLNSEKWITGQIYQLRN